MRGLSSCTVKTTVNLSEVFYEVKQLYVDFALAEDVIIFWLADVTKSGCFARLFRLP